jgi:hypothetical protein
MGGVCFCFVFYCAVCFGVYFYVLADRIYRDTMDNYASVECSAYEVNKI